MASVVMGLEVKAKTAPLTNPDNVKVYAVLAKPPVRETAYVAMFNWETTCEAGVTVTLTAA